MVGKRVRERILDKLNVRNGMKNYVYLCNLQPLDQVGAQRMTRVVAVGKAGGGLWSLKTQIKEF